MMKKILMMSLSTQNENALSYEKKKIFLHFLN